MRDQLVNETIDTRILRLLGLEDVFDLDYETYLVLLREAQIKGKNKIAAEEQALLANERKRVRGKEGRFKPKAKKIKVENVTSVKTSAQRLLPPSKVMAISPFVKSLEIINKSVESISKHVGEQNQTDKKVLDEERKKEENEKRSKREESLESGAKKVMTAAKKMFAPVRGLLDTIYNYLFYTFLGRAVNVALKWLGDPANKKKVDTIFKFVKDWWPAITGAAILFLTPFGAFVRSTIGLVARLTKMTGGVLRFLGKGFGKGVSKAKGKVAGKVGGKLLSRVLPGAQQVLGAAATASDISKGDYFGAALSAASMAPGPFGWAGLLGRTGYGLLKGEYNGGGYIDSNTGVKISGAGPDTQLTALQPGEVVMNRSAVNAIGANNLLALNAKYGGANANRPKFANNIQFAQGGGLVGSLSRFLPQTGTVMAPKGEQFSGQQTTVQKILGMTIPGSQRYTTYSPGDIERYNRLSKSRQLVTGSKFYRSPDGYSQYTSPTTRTQSRSDAIPISPERRRERALTGAVQLNRGLERTLRNVPGAGGYADILKQSGDLGEQELKYQRELERQINILGPQSKAIPSLSPPSRGKSSIITLPPVMQTASAGMTRRPAGTEIPSFSATAPDNRRMDNAAIYGLVG